MVRGAPRRTQESATLQADPRPGEQLLAGLTETQREAVLHEGGPLLIVAGAGTGKTSVITRRIAWLLATRRAAPADILALTFTEKAAAEMEERVDLLAPYGYVETTIRTFHAFGDQLLREQAPAVGFTPYFRVLSNAEQGVFLRRHVFELPLARFRPPADPTRFLEALATVISRAKDEAVGPDEFLAYARAAQAGASDEAARLEAARAIELAEVYAAYARLLREADAMDFGDQVFLAVRLLERQPELLGQLRARFRYILVDEFQDTNYAQFRLLQLLTEPGRDVTVVADDDQSIYKWRGAALSNVVKFLECAPEARTLVLRENFRSPQPVLDAAYRLITHNNPERLEVRQGIDKRLVARLRPQEGEAAGRPREGGQAPSFQAFETVSDEADWVARTIREAVESGGRRPKDFAVLVRSNREADPFLRALNVAGLPWRFSGASGLFAREEIKMLVSCLRTLADPEDSLSWYHVASSSLYGCPMRDLTRLLAQARRRHVSFRRALEEALAPSEEPDDALLSLEGRPLLTALRDDVARLTELSRERSAGQLLYGWLADRNWLARLAHPEAAEDALRLQRVAKFFTHLRRMEELAGPRLPELSEQFELFEALGNEPFAEDDAWADRVNVLTLHKAKGLEFPVVFLVGLVQGRFPTARRKDVIELPEPMIKDLLPGGNYHLQEERRLFYVGMTRAEEELHLTCAYDYGGKSVRKVSQFVLEALQLASPSPPARGATPRARVEQFRLQPRLPVAEMSRDRGRLRLDAYGVDDYHTCPLKYRYSHVLRIPVMRHHLVVYGAALHRAVEEFFRHRLQGGDMSEADLLEALDRAWKAEGFLTHEHETLRRAQAQETLRRFLARQQADPEHPALIEERFRFLLGEELVVVGRWDRVDEAGEGAVIIDYKSSDVREQAAADAKARGSLQLAIYALAWEALRGVPPIRVELHFLESGLVGRRVLTETELARARAAVLEAGRGIRDREFTARPSEAACRWCAYQGICPSAFRKS